MTIPLITIEDYVEFGKLVVRWSQDASTRPTTIAQMREMTYGILNIPDRVTKLDWHDVDLDTFVIRVPNKDMVAEAVEKFGSWQTDYPAPPYYRDLCPGGGEMAAVDLLYSRVADYTIGQCQ